MYLLLLVLSVLSYSLFIKKTKHYTMNALSLSTFPAQRENSLLNLAVNSSTSVEAAASSSSSSVGIVQHSPKLLTSKSLYNAQILLLSILLLSPTLLGSLLELLLSLGSQSHISSSSLLVEEMPYTRPLWVSS